MRSDIWEVAAFGEVAQRCLQTRVALLNQRRRGSHPQRSQGREPLARRHRRAHGPGMFAATAAEADAIRTAWITGGEFSAAIEVRRLFKGVRDMADALACARTIASWTPPTEGHYYSSPEVVTSENGGVTSGEM